MPKWEWSGGTPGGSYPNWTSFSKRILTISSTLAHTFAKSLSGACTIELKVDGKSVLQEALTLKLVSVIDNRIRRKLSDFAMGQTVRASKKKLRAIASVFSTLEEPEVTRNAMLQLDQRIAEAYEEKFEKRGWGTWRQIALKTIRRREWLIRKAGVIVDSKTESDRPLWFTGNLKNRVSASTKMTNFKFLNFDKADKGILEVKELDIGMTFTSKKTSGGKTPPSWYWKKSTRTPFNKLIEHQEKMGWPIWLTQPEFLEKVWLPWLNLDFPKLFRRGAFHAKTTERAIKLAKGVEEKIKQEFKLGPNDVLEGSAKWKEMIKEEHDEDLGIGADFPASAYMRAVRERVEAAGGQVVRNTRGKK